LALQLKEKHREINPMKKQTVTRNTIVFVLLPLAIFARLAVNGQSSGANIGTTVITTATVSTNVAISKTVTASSSDNEGHTAQYAVDGNQRTRFSTAASDNQWLSVDLGKAYLLTSIMFLWDKSYGKDFDILFSNSGSFTDLYSASIQVRNHVLNANAIAAFDTLLTRSNTVARYVKIQGIHSAGGNGYSIWEMQVIGVTSSTSLFPVSVTGFTGTPANNATLLEWTTITEYSNAGFSVEHSNDAVNFSEIAWVAGRNAGTVTTHYAYTDKQAATGKNYYRLKQTWLDGKIGYSPVITVSVSGSSSVNAYPVPVKDHLTIDYKANAGESISIALFNTGGFPVYTCKLPAQGTQQTMTINRTAAMIAGEYFLTVTSSDNKKYSKKIVLQ